MERGTSMTPCRRVGLRRTASASKSDSNSNVTPTATSSALKTHDDTPKSRVGLFSTGDRSNNVHCSKLVGETPAVPPEPNKSTTNILNTSLQDSFQQEKKCERESKHHFSSPCSSRLGTNDNNCEQRNSKKPKLDLTTTCTVEDLHALQREVGLKERKLRELRQADIILKKHNPDRLREDIKTWLQACQSALQELLANLHSKGSNMDMHKLLCELGIPSTLVHYNDETDDFE